LTSADAPTKFNILDNSFFVEEAFNQERGILDALLAIQIIFGARCCG
jgi:hypothetical protein